MPTPTSLSISAGDHQTTVALAVVAAALKVLVRDETNAPLPGASVTWVLPTTGPRGTFPGPVSTAVTIADGTGVATAPAITAGSTAGAWSPVAKLTLTPAVQVTFSLAIAATGPVRSTSFAIVAGNNQTVARNAAFPIALKVKALDAFGNPVAGSSVRFTTTSAAFFPGHTSSFDAVTDASGIATAGTLTASTNLGGFQVTARDQTGTAPNVKFDLTVATVTPSVATTLLLVSGGGQSGYTAAAFPAPIVARVVDQFGANFPGASVTFSLPVGYATFPGGQTSVQVSNASGLVTSPTITAGAAAGAYVCTLSTPSVASITATLTNVDPAVVTNLAYVDGNAQAAAISAPFAAPLRVKATDGLGGPVAGVNVTYTAPGAGASCTMAGSNVQVVASAAGTGIAAASPIANGTNGTYSVVASSPGLTNVTFTLTNGAAPPVTDVSRAMQYSCF